MTLVTRWHPDTCSCIIEYDHNAGDDTFIHTATIQACPRHAAVSGQAHFDAVLSHNRAKNSVHNFVMKQQGVIIDRLHCFYDVNDILHVAGHGADIIVLQALVNSQFGTGKIVVVS
jgi:hypothetical protein